MHRSSHGNHTEAGTAQPRRNAGHGTYANISAKLSPIQCTRTLSSLSPTCSCEHGTFIHGCLTIRCRTRGEGEQQEDARHCGPPRTCKSETPNCSLVRLEILPAFGITHRSPIPSPIPMREQRMKENINVVDHSTTLQMPNLRFVVELFQSMNKVLVKSSKEFMKSLHFIALL